jgi:hypothetical protein
MAITSIKLILPTYHRKNIAKKRRNVKSKDSLPCSGPVSAGGVTIRKHKKTPRNGKMAYSDSFMSASSDSKNHPKEQQKSQHIGITGKYLLARKLL